MWLPRYNSSSFAKEAGCSVLMTLFADAWEGLHLQTEIGQAVSKSETSMQAHGVNNAQASNRACSSSHRSTAQHSKSALDFTDHKQGRGGTHSGREALKRGVVWARQSGDAAAG